MSGKFALIIGNTEYTDPGLAQLTAPGQDAKEFGRVLDSPDIGAFDDVIILFNENESKVSEAIDYFFSLKKPDDLLVLFFSGHGVRDEYGSLYLAVKNTNRARLRSTAIKSDFIRDAMDQSRSRRQVLILDCCNSGAFAQGTKAEAGGSVGTASAFEGTGYGRVVLTASDSTQFAWEGDKVIGADTTDSLFTHFLVKGLEGEADRDGDGKITVDELYDYAYEQIVDVTPKQTPGKWSYKQQGEIVLRQSTRIETIKPIPLPDDLSSEIKDLRPYVREAAVQQLEGLLKGKNLGLARSAREALEKIASEDDSRRVLLAATQALESVHQAEQLAMQKAEEEGKAKKEADRIAAQKIEEERIAREKAEAERKARGELERRVREKVEAEWKTQEEANRLAAQKAEEERIAKVEAERLAEEPQLATEKAETERKAREETERFAGQKAGAERKAKEERLAYEKAERQKMERESKDNETRGKAEKRRQKYLELRNKTTDAIKLYYRHILLFSIAIGLIAVAGIFVPTLLRSTSSSIPHPTLLLSKSASPRPTAPSPPLFVSSSTPRPTSTRIPTQIPTPTLTPLPIVMKLYDDFNSGNLDSKKWAFGQDPGLTTIQQDGVLKLSADTGVCGASGCGGGVTIVGGTTTVAERPLSLTNAIEAKMFLANEFGGSVFYVLLKVRADLPYHSAYICYMVENSDEQYFECSSDISPRHTSKRIPVARNQYYTVQIEVDPSNATFRAYLNNGLVDVFEPSNPDQLKNLKFIFSVLLGVGSNTSGSALVDDVRLGKPTSP